MILSIVTLPRFPKVSNILISPFSLGLPFSAQTNSVYKHPKDQNSREILQTFSYTKSEW